ncbi:Eukaryotic translation initiation factor 3 subunit G {ECO:0000255/HAMAP-Rule:MF_03006} Short=eIF3g {ECO:0000255/HAMAP-Rule:MF_03006}; AltName: Full=Eukaryotic translation initiation factor 3 RNA-binding subunit {ECO:0000255/HAMAP-Rule:MF_03006}; Short=eIF-3 RNA-binding subunit {ECO:0000255/HAMAP-Rule:MF_03006}; AltName: Full=Translation initiation factor eIF3 p33 subunit homolog {ECO:0000255/HAMAP-Rule:MF_03006}; Short=eIF3 p33 homolog {ECO:0000255/HAMAP-Rule:MF_03006} [Serendipita indica DSM 11827]|nr:Eukaryotic translation initiation factor 3 subunit G {ECO:0000255/HAMAP-Rule:MF_03006} Short=eIF3g {ECO:0000255/HAMAP-Rule:MF_03006}; AltName: Full=Eukaryotic translation initiation factor 3 RNA-binding subunit {ECO:0000255/HAMAP-Rule:MF_03006}; Short=eIF-3 RNA-binding subunit {ECO:0000255/HAMAP-Rule:MF_03006}; AltName: Full=Translation initiation factor eIF3 p33 subunit homolog {ECO:0000255/HAMAP-Rule:MF_03006}; Short=eIF3 p33 homolog {ECO:0000255/HAMAP-Rule:MF_03006} [Serendipita indica DSM 11
MPVEIGKSWADDVEELEDQGIEETVDDEGVRTVTQITTNEDGKKVKIVRKFRRVEKRTLVNHQVAERKTWAKFGAEKNSKPGPNKATTTVGENVTLKIHPGSKAAETEQQEQVKNPLAGKKVKYVNPDDVPPAGAAAAQPGAKYVPPHRTGGGESMTRTRDDLPTLRVTNVSEDATDDDLRDLFSRFGRVHRVYIGRDRETGQGKGYAFVSFEDRAVAERAMQKVHGMGYDNLILNCQWSQPREARPAPA